VWIALETRGFQHCGLQTSSKKRFWHGYCSESKPLLVQNKLFILGGYDWTENSGVVVLNPDDGKEMARFGRTSSSTEEMTHDKDSIYFTTEQREGYKPFHPLNRLYSIDAFSLKTRWTIDYAFTPVTTKDLVIASMPDPVVTDGQPSEIVGSTKLDIVAFHKADGHEVWRIHNEGWWDNNKPIIANNHLLYLHDGLVEIDTEAGRLVKLSDLSFLSRNCRILKRFLIGDKRLLLHQACKNESSIYVVDISNGEEVWRRGPSFGIDLEIGIVEDKLLIGAGLGWGTTFDTLDLASGESTSKFSLNWHFWGNQLGGDQLLHQNEIIMAHNDYLLGLDPFTGKIVRQYLTGEITAPPLVIGDKVYVNSEDCNVYGLRLEPPTSGVVQK